MGWRDTITTEAAPASSWRDTVKEDPGVLESAGRGALQGVSLGFGDEIYGGGKALFDALNEGDLSDLEGRYRSERDAVRKANAAAEEANPTAYTGGNIAGSVATSFVPGLNIAKAATLGGRVALGAGLGAAAGLGNSDADVTQGEVGQAALDTAKGAALGGGLVAGGEKLVAPAARFIGGKAKDAMPVLSNAAAWTGDKLAQSAAAPASEARGGLLDLGMAAASGLAMGDPTAGILTAIGRRAAAPYAKQGGALVANKVSELLKTDPSKLGKFAAPLMEAAKRGNKSLAATQYLLQQRDPEFSQMKKQLEEQN